MHDIGLRRDEIAWREIDGEVIAVDLRSSTYLSTNGSGTTLWHALVAGTTRAGLADALVQTYSIDQATAERDVDAFLADLTERGLLDAPVD
jgi:Coenzyme PQQ synthesis protein D (PqqD)